MSLPNCYRCHAQPCACRDNQTLYTGDCLGLMAQFDADSVDLIFGSPPYLDARTYGIGAQRDCLEWVGWMLEISEAAARVSRGPVLWVVAGMTRGRNYQPACEGLLWEWWRRGGTHQLYRPAIYHRVGIPGSGGDDWFRSDWEYVICLKRPGKLVWSDNTAAGHPARWAPGGEMSHRLADGARVNHRKVQTRRKKNGSHGHDGMHNQEQDYQEPAIANPGNLLTGVGYLESAQAALDAYERGDVRSGRVGGGQMGDRLAHENEASFPEWLAEVFVCSFCPEGGTILDPFSGSGSSLAVARKWGRCGIGIDVRESQSEIAARRLAQGVLFP